MSFKDKLLGRGVAFSDGNLEGIFGKNESDFELLEGDVNMSMVNGISAISFSDRIKDILFKEMELTVILKLLWRNIGYNVLHNYIDDYNKVLTQGPWIIFRQYLTIQPWTKMFNPVQTYPSMVTAWIRLSGLPGYLYKRKIIEAIGELIKKVIKLDLQTDNKTNGRLPAWQYSSIYIKGTLFFLVEIPIEDLASYITYAYFKVFRGVLIRLSKPLCVGQSSMFRCQILGGLLRDHNGNWIVGFTRYLGNCEVIDSELWGILDGLRIALDRGYQKVIIRTDNL
ncbi:hypothetical protein Goshw_000613 [Gossypium schwendimanii]|uniref:RNase H type-1 domain-containing protein n=1 Tax=Gossypium schwendimanii TaxID=34291 RepID=A0A7J9ML66_GOSSC|nr:hypothetical protein [Gossypium schwendimanii]